MPTKHAKIDNANEQARTRSERSTKTHLVYQTGASEFAVATAEESINGLVTGMFRAGKQVGCPGLFAPTDTW